MLALSYPTTQTRHIPPMWSETGAGSKGHDVLDCLHVPIILLDLQGNVLFCNVRAQQFGRVSRAVEIREGRRLRFLDDDAEHKLRAALRQFSDASKSEHQARLSIVAYRPDDACDRPLICTFHHRGDTVVATLIDTAEASPETGIECFMDAFRLTSAERRLACHLVSGGRLSSAARSFGLSRHTVGNQLRSIFDKVGVRRQSDLLRIMLAGCA